MITGSLNYVPRLVMDVVEKAPNRDLQSRLTAVAAAVERHGLPGVKAAAAAARLRLGTPRLPLESLSDELAAELATLVQDA